MREVLAHWPARPSAAATAPFYDVPSAWPACGDGAQLPAGFPPRIFETIADGMRRSVDSLRCWPTEARTRRAAAAKNARWCAAAPHARMATSLRGNLP